MRNMIFSFVSLALAVSLWGATPVPYQIESFDDYANSGWVETRNGGVDTQETTIVQEGTGSLKLDFSATSLWDMVPSKTFGTAIDMTPSAERALTLWLHNDRVAVERIHQIIVYDSMNRLARFPVVQTAETGWQKITAPLASFVPDAAAVDYSDIVRIDFWCSTYAIHGGPIYFDDFQLVEFISSWPITIETFDNYAASGWADNRVSGLDKQETTIVHDGTGSLKIDYADPSWDNDWDIVPQKTFVPNLDFTPVDKRVLKLWVYNDHAGRERLNQFILIDVNSNVARYTVPEYTETGWKQISAPISAFVPDGGSVDFTKIQWIQLWCTTWDTLGGAIYLDQLELDLLVDPLQLADFDDFANDGWSDSRGTLLVVQENPAEGPAEGAGSMRIKYEDRTANQWDIVPRKVFGSIDLTVVPDPVVAFWVWSDLVGSARVNQLILYDVNNYIARFSPPAAAEAGWRQVQAPLDAFAIDGGMVFDFTQVKMIDFWITTWDTPGNSIYIDDLRIQTYVPVCNPTNAALVEAVYATPTIDADPSDWASLGSEVVEINLAEVATDNGNLHARYRLAWDMDYLYVLIEELPGDGLASEAECVDGCLYAMNDGSGGGTYYDNLALFFDFDDTGVGAGAGPIDAWLFFGMSSTGTSDLVMAWTNGGWGPHKPEAVANANTATSGTLGSRVIESRLSWQDLATAIDESRQPEGGLLANVGPGMMFGCDPRLNDFEMQNSWISNAEEGAAWFNGLIWTAVSGFDAFSVDVTLTLGTCADVLGAGYAFAGDLDNDCAVGITDFDIMASEWLTAGVEADIIVDSSVDFEDFAAMAVDWLLCNDPENMDCVANWPVYEPCIP